MQPRIKGRKATVSRRAHDVRYDETCAKHARLALKRFVEAQPSQEKAAALLRLHQGTLSRALKVDAQPTIRVLLALSLVTGRTLDELLGLELPVREHVRRASGVHITDSTLTRIAERVREVAEMPGREWSHHKDNAPFPAPPGDDTDETG